MTAIETIKELFTLKTDLVTSASKSADFTDDDALLKSVCRWAAQRCDEDEEAVVKNAQSLAANMWGGDMTILRDILEVGLEADSD